MRLIGSFSEEKQAKKFCIFLQLEGIGSSYEKTEEGTTNYSIWVENEDDCPKALEWLEKFSATPEDPMFANVREIPEQPPVQEEKISELPKRPVRMQRSPLTTFLIAVCSILFFLTSLEMWDISKAEGPLVLQIGLSPIERELLFDYPKAYEELLSFVKEYSLRDWKETESLSPEATLQLEKIQSTPSWLGVYGLVLDKVPFDQISSIPMFEKIKEGEFWRLFSPCLIHRDFLHILFNMAWLWILGKQMEPRIGKWRMLFFIVVTAILSNVAQYLVSGPYFLGFSGVACAMAGFIWMRQKIAPWEGYPLQKEAIYFLFFFVLAMSVLGVVSFAVQMVSSESFLLGIANTAHVVGGLSGILLGRFSFLRVK